MDTSVDGSKKPSLEDLSKEDIIKKYRGLLNLLQKAKQSKDALIEENSCLKQRVEEKANVSNTASEELLEKLTQQKLDLVTSLEEVKSNRDVIQNKLKDCEIRLLNADERIIELDTTNQGYLRQITRLTEENEQLLTHLDALEKQTEELRQIGLQQQQQLLELEKSKSSAVDLSEIENLKVELGKAQKTNENSIQNIKDLTEENKQLTGKIEELSQGTESLKTNYKNAEALIANLKISVEEKTKQNETHLNTADDLNTELHKNRALVEKLQNDVHTMSSKLSDNQIVSSGVTSDLQNTNEKLRDKLKFYHSKIVKLAIDVKVLKQQKTLVLDDFRNYVRQVKLWEAQLQEFSAKVLLRFNESEDNKLEAAKKIDTFIAQIENLQKDNNNLQKHNGELASSVQELKLKIETNQVDNKLSEELNKSKQQIEQLNNELKVLHGEHNSSITTSENLTSELKILKDQHEKEKGALSDEIENLSQSNCSLQENLQQKLEELKSQENRAEGKCQEYLQEIAKLNATINKLQAQNDLLKATEVKLAEQSANEIKKLVKHNEELLKSSTELEQRLVDAQNAVTKSVSDCDSQTNAAEDQLSIIKRENTELLTEMNEMNQVLKERGETISKQQEYCEELLRNIKVYESQSNKLAEVVRQKEEIITKLEHDLNILKNQSLTQSSVSFNEMHGTIIKKDEEISRLQNELSILKEKLNTSHTLDSSHEASYAESETMSTSTMSRIEEGNRIKDLEGSWEERYGKLRSLALKLKGKIRDLTAELTTEQNEKTEIQQKLASSLKTTQTLQAQCDTLQDELEQGKKELKNYSKKLDAAALDISNSKKQLANDEETIIKLKADIENLNKEKTNTDNWKKQVSSKVQNLRKELEANTVLKKDFENQIAKLNTQLEAKDKLLKEEIEKHTTTKNSLHESHNERKKQSVLNLEMQDYERSLKDLTQKLDKKQELITKLKNQIDSQKSTVSSVKEQNRLLEDRIQTEETELKSARGEIQAYKKSISDLEAVLIQKDDKIQDLTRTLETCRAENEDLSTQLSKIVADHQRDRGILKTEKDYIKSHHLSLEQHHREVQDTLKLKTEELKELQTEYQSYKVRAQSVLRQNQTRDVGLEEKLSEEVASFKAQATVLLSEVSELKATLETLKEENAKLKMGKEQVEAKQQQLIRELEDTRSQYDVLTAKHQKAISEHAEAIRSLKINAETLAQCYRQQLSEQEVRHNREIIELQSKIEKVAPAPEVPPLSPPSIPREQGEGSESVDTKQSLNTRPVPLDRLLSNESDHDVGFIKKQLTENEAKVTHLTALLADTEQDLAKHVQMNKLLKEEIRRQQRSVEREKHAENLEYLKNVVFKFATLNSGDERSRLVPVLNTILKFSPEETNKLNSVARGDLGSRGWANYLPVWSSPGRPQ